MQIAPIALLVGMCLLALGFWLRAPILATLLGSLSFGATAIASLPAVGGATLLLFVPVAGLLVATVAVRRSFRSDLAKVFTLGWPPTIVALLLVYGVGSAFIMPRLYAGETTVFIPSSGAIIETTLMPVSGNINQAAYLTLGILTYFALATLLVRDARFAAIRAAFFLFAALNAALGTIDVLGKASGAGDLLQPFRTAGYSMLVEVQVEGFWRIVGAYSEASTFGAATLITLAFTFSYWQNTGWRPALLLSCVLLLLLLLSTSTTGYAGLAALAACLVVSRVWGFAFGRLQRRDFLVLSVVVVLSTTVIGVLLFSERSLEPVEKLIDTTILQKSTSDSADERFYWNRKSWQAFVDTGGLGVGLGSSRASSSIFAVISQLGVIVAILIALLMVDLARGPDGGRPQPEHSELAALCRSLRVTGFAAVIPAAISGGSADPGILFFIILAALLVGRKHLATEARIGRHDAAVTYGLGSRGLRTV